MAGPTVVVSVLADSKPFKSAMDDIGGAGSRMGGLLKAGVGIAAGALAGLSVAAVKAVGDASSLEQSIGGVASVFGGFADQVNGFAAAAANAVGLSANSYNELATIIGTTLKNSGTPMEALAGATDDLVSRSADLAATFGGPVTDASNAVASALRGEFEPLRRYGVALSQAEINARALADTGKTNADQLTKQEKALATQALIFEQSADAAGAFARESDTLAGQQERLAANAENLSAKVGGALLPAFTALATAANNLLSGLMESEGFDTFVQGLSDLVVGLVSGESGLAVMSQGLAQILPLFSPLSLILQALMPLLPTLTGSFMQLGQALGGALTAVLPSLVSLVQVLVQALSGVFAAVLPVVISLVTQLADTFAVLMPELTPVIELVAGILSSALTALVPIIATVAETIGAVLSTALTAVQPLLLLVADVLGQLLTAAMPIIDAVLQIVAAFMPLLPVVAQLIGALLPPLVQIIMALLQPILALIQPLLGLLAPALQFVGQVLGAIIGVVAQVISTFVGLITGSEDAQRGVENVWNNVLGFFRGIPAAIGGFFSDAVQWLVSAGRNIIEGLWNGIKGMFDSVTGWVKGLVDGLISNVKGWFGIKSPSTVFRGIGQNIGQGLAIGILGTRDLVNGAMGSLADSVTAGFDPQLSLAGSYGAYDRATRASRGNSYEIKLPVGMPAAEAGRAIVDAIDEFERQNGKR